ncbi:MAG TPA: zinc ribbon domain-containing protein [Pyrinomonadaceae bacterium]|nr:zinc ribbon domain-containing protein [Pyrinomonadaceae bacterium]
MFCPQCGLKQLSNDARFCSGCGLPLDNVSALLVRGGQLPVVPPASRRLTPRQKGMRQGAMLMLSTLAVVPLVAIIGVALLELPGEIAGLTAIICFGGGLLRLLYALLFEENFVTESSVAQQYVPPAVTPNYLGTPERSAALPPATPADLYRRPRYDTGELAGRQPSSVTDHTTQLLDREPAREPRDPQ